MEREIERTSESEFKVIDYTPSETVYTIEQLESEIYFANNSIIEYNETVAKLESLIVEKQALLEKVKKIPAPVIETPEIEQVIDEPME